MPIKGQMLSAVFLGALLIGCSSSATKSPDLTPQIRQSLDQAGLKSVDIKQDREKGVVTLSGNVNADADKAQAESIAKSIAGTEVVSNQIAVRPPGDQSATKDADAALDSGIEQNVKAMLLQHKLNHDVDYHVKNGVVTLTGKVNSQSKRSSTEQLTAAIPNVKQVVNELQVKNQKATSSR